MDKKKGIECYVLCKKCYGYSDYCPDCGGTGRLKISTTADAIADSIIKRFGLKVEK